MLCGLWWLDAGCAGTVAALTQLYGDAWKQQGVALLNDQIKGELVVQDVDLSWWNGFPNISVDLWEATHLARLLGHLARRHTHWG